MSAAPVVLSCSGVVWYNHSKLRALKAKAAQQDGKSDEDLEQPLLQNRSKADILSEIQRLQRDMDVLERRPGSSSKLKGSPYGSSNTIRIIANGGDSSSSNSSSPGSGVVRGEEHARAIAAVSSRQFRV